MILLHTKKQERGKNEPWLSYSNHISNTNMTLTWFHHFVNRTCPRFQIRPEVITVAVKHLINTVFHYRMVAKSVKYNVSFPLVICPSMRSLAIRCMYLE